ncbi:MAG TPA: hypothetical protein VL899_13955 [Alphaproteobacteria bacterium]|nr:hypothetical protein [Alphaproteobacteria bacterium]
MSVDEFRQTLAAASPPAELDASLTALWWDAKGDWDKAHACVDHGSGAQDMRVHAYLHRKEPDPANAAYWYRRTGRRTPDMTLDAEREELLRDLLTA